MSTTSTSSTSCHVSNRETWRHLEAVSSFHRRVASADKVSSRGESSAGGEDLVGCAEHLATTVQHMRQVFEQQKRQAHSLQLVMNNQQGGSSSSYVQHHKHKNPNPLLSI